MQLPGQPAPSVRTLKDFHMEQTPVLAVRDTGFQHSLAAGAYQLHYRAARSFQLAALVA